LTEGVDPIFVPEQMQEMVIEIALENLDFERVIRVSMYTKVFNFRQRNRLIVVLLATGWWLITFWVRSESADIHLPSRDGPVRVDLYILEITNAPGRLADDHKPRRRQTGLGTAGSSSGSTHRYQRASTRTQGASGTSRSRSRDGQPVGKVWQFSTGHPTVNPKDEG
jgi:hypothetical protein